MHNSQSFFYKQFDFRHIIDKVILSMTEIHPNVSKAGVSHSLIILCKSNGNLALMIREIRVYTESYPQIQKYK